MNTKKWDIFEELKNEEDIQAFVEASIEEAENDTDPSLHALGVERGVCSRLFVRQGVQLILERFAWETFLQKYYTGAIIPSVTASRLRT
ncbi:MAG: hypothetical protein LBT14_03155 [Treponema sp.]|jgi:hypothetical protein|nr:hypothetical protein [Treponema sp.]